MFFGKKAPAATFLPDLAAFFGLTEQQVTNWPQGNNVIVPFACQSRHEELKQALGGNVQISQAVTAVAANTAPVPGVKNIIAVTSGKGGVGKSATTVNLAFALFQEGARVGILDADIYGPSIPIMLGNAGQYPTSPDDKHMHPNQAHGLVANSIGYLVEADKATVWRGPMASKALMQMLRETLWPDLDYLLIDMPPGTGDIQLTLAQQIPVSGAVIVTTPQDLALADATKGIAMFEQVNVPVLGVVENMSYYQCRACGHKDYLFATDGGKKLAQQRSVPLLGQLPLDIQIRQHADDGTPLLVAEPDSPLSASYRQAARALAKALYLRSVQAGAKIPVHNQD
ncbi:iron-sulfur cluster carrier protein ApbC [Bowmanella sp. JS7-9]|uniref:iron-sulfur cluster carrier protein ApbC n=1 Tax=Alteromonadaceae TaxID=72275 RepID=UPI001040BBD3|nr:iron-sulfur cluster carrier protein ApbC [Bowmanella sp. JS7-9]